ncbi:hypothetical protein Tco_0078973 [Tanacetum coccineum]
MVYRFGNLLKQDVGNVSVWVKLHGVPLIAFSEDGLSAIATKLGTSLMLDSYTSDIYILSWGRSSYARALIEVQENMELKDNIVDECPKNIDSDVVKNMKKPSQTPRGVSVGPKVRFKPVKQVFRQVSKKTMSTLSGNMKKNAEPTIEVSNSNSFGVLISVENDVDLGKNGGTSNLASKKANSSGSSLVIDEKVTLMDDEGKPLTKVVSSGDRDSEDEVG